MLQLYNTTNYLEYPLLVICHYWNPLQFFLLFTLQYKYTAKISPLDYIDSFLFLGLQFSAFCFFFATAYSFTILFKSLFPKEMMLYSGSQRIVTSCYSCFWRYCFLGGRWGSL